MDPKFVQAQAELANLLIGALGDTRPRFAIEPRARELVRRALSLDPDSASARAASGNFAFQFDLDWPGAEEDFRKAIELNPSDRAAHFWYALMCIALQRYEDTREQARLYSLLDPGNPNAYAIASWACRLAGNVPAAIEAALHCVGQTTEGHSQLAEIYGECGRIEDARREAHLAIDALLARGQLRPAEEYYLARVRAWLFDSRVEAKTLVARWNVAPGSIGVSREYAPRQLSAGLYTILGDYERALTLLEEDSSVGDRTLWYYYQDAVLDPIRSDPRFIAMLKAMRLPTSMPWKRSTLSPS